MTPDNHPNPLSPKEKPDAPATSPHLHALLDALAAAMGCKPPPLCVGTIGGMSRVCPCGRHRVFDRQASQWVCPVCQRSQAIAPSES